MDELESFEDMAAWHHLEAIEEALAEMGAPLAALAAMVRDE